MGAVAATSEEGCETGADGFSKGGDVVTRGFWVRDQRDQGMVGGASR